jgi:hypothetical protein
MINEPKQPFQKVPNSKAPNGRYWRVERGEEECGRAWKISDDEEHMQHPLSQKTALKSKPARTGCEQREWGTNKRWMEALSQNGT